MRNRIEAVIWPVSMAVSHRPRGVMRRRMIAINVDLGFMPEEFFPKGSGKNYELSPYLKLLVDLKNQFNHDRRELTKDEFPQPVMQITFAFEQVVLNEPLVMGHVVPGREFNLM